MKVQCDFHEMVMAQWHQYAATISQIIGIYLCRNAQRNASLCSLNVLLFFVIHGSEMNTFGFWPVGQTKQDVHPYYPQTFY